MSNLIKDTANQTFHAPVAKRTVAQLSDGSVVAIIYDQNIAGGGGSTAPAGSGGGGGGGGTITARSWSITEGPMGEGTVIGTAAALSWVPGNSTNFATTTDLRQPVCMEMCFRIVSTAENSTTDWTTAYDYIEDIGDQRGYTGGLIGFTSATQDMEDLVQRYVALVPGSPLASYISGLAQCSTIGYGPSASAAATTYLGNGFKTAWANAANNDPIFRRLQREMRKEIYWDDALAQALADGVGPLGLALHYDILVNHGPGNDSESYGGILAAARGSTSKPPSAGGNEKNYLTKLCDIRDAVLQSWGDYQSDGRSTIYRGLNNANKQTLVAPFSWSVYSEDFSMSTRPTPTTDSVLGDYTLRYTAVGAGSDDMVVHVNPSGTTNQGTGGTPGTLSAGTDATILAGQTLTRTATEPSGSGGNNGGGSQTVYLPSDGSNVGKWYLYHSVDRLTWTLKSTVTPTTAPALKDEYCIYSMTADSNNNIYLAFGGRDDSVRHYRWTTAGSGTSRTFTASSQETAMAAPGSGFDILRLDIDVLTGTTAALVAVQWRQGTNMGYRFLLRRLQDNTWVTSYTYTIWTNQANPAWADISVAWDSNNSSGSDENGRTWFALYVSKISTTTDFGDDVVQWALNPTNGSSIVTSSQQTSNNLNVNLGSKVRRGTLFSTAPGRYTLLGAVGTANFFSFVLTFTNGGTQPVPYVRSQQTGITVNKLVSGSNDVGFAWQDYRAIVAYGGTDGRAYCHVYTFETGNVTPTTGTTNYAFDNFFRNGNSRYAAWFCGGSNRFAWSFFKNLDMIVWDAPSGDAIQGSRAWRHHYNQPPVAPKVVTPSQGSQVTSNIPALTADVDLDMDYPQSKVKVVWQLARDNLFTQNLRTVEEPDANFRYLTMSGSTSAFTKVSAQVPADSALFTGTWYVRAAFISELGLQGAWSATQSFFVGHPASGKDLHPSGDEFWTFATPSTFNWVFTDTAEGDYQTAYQIVVEQADTGGVLYNTGKVTSGLPVGTVAIDAIHKDKQLRWRLKLWDMDDTEGAFSDYQTFFLGDGPVVDVFAPTEGSVVATPTPVIEWSVDLEGWRTLKSFRVVARRTIGDMIDYDSGWRAIGLADPYTFLIDNPTGIQNNSAYDLYVYVRDAKGLEGGDHVQFTTSWIPPDAPNFTVNGSLFTENGYVTVFWNNSSQDPTWTAWRIYRRAYNYDLQAYSQWELLKEYTNATTSYSYQDWAAPANSNIQYAVVQVATRFEAPVESVYNAQSLTTTSSDYWLINPLNNALNLRVHMNTEGFQDEYEQEVYHVLGRGRHVDQGDRLGYSGSFTVRFRDKLAHSARQQRLEFEAVIKRQLPVYLRSPFGDVTYVVLMNASYERVPGMGEHEAVDLSCDYVEVAP